METIPEVIVFKIIFYLDVRSIGRLYCVSKRFKIACEDEAIWQRLYDKEHSSKQLTQLLELERNFESLDYRSKFIIACKLEKDQQHRAKVRMVLSNHNHHHHHHKNNNNNKFATLKFTKQSKNATRRFVFTEIKKSVKLPDGEMMEEWIASNVFEFFSEINRLYGEIADHCTSQSCPTMSAGPKYEYLWADEKDEKYKKPTQMLARDYIETLFNWALDLFEDEEFMPSDADVKFPKNFLPIIKTVFKRLFRVFAHIYHHHFEDLEKIKATTQFNEYFKHYYLFVQEFHLIAANDLKPMHAIIEKIKSSMHDNGEHTQ